MLTIAFNAEDLFYCTRHRCKLRGIDCTRRQFTRAGLGCLGCEAGEAHREAFEALLEPYEKRLRFAPFDSDKNLARYRETRYF